MSHLPTDSLTLNQTPAKAARPWTWSQCDAWCTCLLPNWC